jgi:hypothetical protein
MGRHDCDTKNQGTEMLPEYHDLSSASARFRPGICHCPEESARGRQWAPISFLRRAILASAIGLIVAMLSGCGSASPERSVNMDVAATDVNQYGSVPSRVFQGKESTPQAEGQNMSEESTQTTNTVIQSAQRYLASEKGVMDFGPDARAGVAYPVFSENGFQESWIVEVKRDGHFVGAVLRSTDAKGDHDFLSAVFPIPKQRFWTPSSDEAVAKFRSIHTNSTNIEADLSRDNAGYFWRITGRTHGKTVDLKVYTRY